MELTLQKRLGASESSGLQHLAYFVIQPSVYGLLKKCVNLTLGKTQWSGLCTG